MFTSSRIAAVALAAGAAFAGTAAVAAPAYAAGAESAPATPSAADVGTKAAHLCVTAHDQMPLYAGPHLNSGIIGFLDGGVFVVADLPADGLAQVSRQDNGAHLGYAQQADLVDCVGPLN